jgi:hypothetical protein
MTLIAIYKREKSYAMLGDLLLSKPTAGEQPVEIPARFDKRFPLTNLNLSGLQQKVFRISPTVAVAWAGSLLTARHIIREVAKLPQPYDGRHIRHCINSMELTKAELDSVSLLFLTTIPRANGQIDVTGCAHGYEQWANPANPSEQMRYAGSGSYHFLEMYPFAVGKRGGRHNDQSETLGALIGRAAQTILLEVVSDEPHDFFYGGGFEVMIISSVGFVKVPLKFVFWMIDEDKIELVGPIFSHLYDKNGILGLRRFVRDGESWDQKIFTVRNFMHSGESAQFEPETSIDTYWTCHYLINNAESERVFIVHDWGATSLMPPLVKFNYQKGMINWKATPEFWMQLMDAGLKLRTDESW